MVIKLSKKMKIILIATVVAILAIITIIVFILVGTKKTDIIQEKKEIDVSALETNFKNLCDNNTNDYVGTWYNISVEEDGKYNIEAKIPYIMIDETIDNKVNTEINNLFVKTLLTIYDESQQNTRFEINYASSINGDILSLMIRCILKQGANAQRTIIKTYNYNLNTFEEVNILDVVAAENREKLQEEIHQKIQKEIDKENRLAQQGYNSYKRDVNSDIYELQNATEFFIKDNILYIIYSYGNRNYTSTVDLIITEI